MIITPLLKKPSLDRESLSNYRPISNLSFVSKLTERVIKDRLHEHLSHKSMFNIFQSSYTTFHSTKSAILVIHDHPTKAMDRQQVTGLTLLDLSAAFDTIDHSILHKHCQFISFHWRISISVQTGYCHSSAQAPCGHGMVEYAHGQARLS